MYENYFTSILGSNHVSWKLYLNFSTELQLMVLKANLPLCQLVALKKKFESLWICFISCQLVFASAFFNGDMGIGYNQDAYCSIKQVKVLSVRDTSHREAVENNYLIQFDVISRLISTKHFTSGRHHAPRYAPLSREACLSIVRCTSPSTLHV